MANRQDSIDGLDEDQTRLCNALNNGVFEDIQEIVNGYIKDNIGDLDDFLYKQAPSTTVLLLTAKSALPDYLQRGQNSKDVQDVIKKLVKRGAHFLRSLVKASEDSSNRDVVAVLLDVLFNECIQQQRENIPETNISEEDEKKLRKVASEAAKNKQFLKAVKHVYLLERKQPTTGIDSLDMERKDLELNKTRAEPFFLSFKWLWERSSLCPYHDKKTFEASQSKEKVLKTAANESFMLDGCELHRMPSFGALPRNTENCEDKSPPTIAKDVLLEALEFSSELRDAAICEHHLLSEYRRLSNQAEEFAVALIDEVKDERELAVVMGLQDQIAVEGEDVLGWKGKDMSKLSLLHIAVQKRCELFVASKNCQHLLDEIIFGNSQFLRWNKRRPFFGGGVPAFFQLLLKVIVGCIVAGFMTCAIVVYIPVSIINWRRGNGGHCKFLVELFERPCQKFLIDLAFYITFLGFVIYASSEEDFAVRQAISGMTTQDIILFVFVVGYSLRLLLHFCQYICENPTNRSIRLILPNALTVNNTVCMSLFLCAFGLWILRWNKFGGWHPEDKIFRNEDICFSVASILSFLNLTQFLKAHKALGTLELSLHMMLTKDVIYFGVIFAILFLAFGTGIRKMYSYYVAASKALGQRNETQPLASYTETYDTLFWLLTGIYERRAVEINDDNYQDVEVVGKVMVALYTVCTVLVALNMLIATMNRTYERIMKNVETEYQLSRTQMWLNYISENHSVLPPPLNVGDIMKIFECIYKTCKEKIRPSRQVSKEREKKRLHVIKILVLRYLCRSLGLEEILDLQDSVSNTASVDGNQKIDRSYQEQGQDQVEGNEVV